MNTGPAAIRRRVLPHLRLDIGYGTERFPAPVARRLRAVNVAAWLGAVALAAFAVIQFLEPLPGLRKVALLNAVMAASAAAIPLLHRFGPAAAPLVLVATAYVYFFVIAALLGTGTGIYLYYLASMALVVLFFGTERRGFIIVFGVLAPVLAIAAEILLPHSTGVLPRAHLLGHFAGSVIGSCAILFAVVLFAIREVDQAEEAVTREYERSEALLLNILPADVARRLKTPGGSVLADRYEDASVLFADMEGFTGRADDTTPEELVRFLNRVFTDFDRLVTQHGLEKIKTSGDAYMVVSGVPTPRADHAAALADLALALRAVTTGLLDPHGRRVPVRIGMASGPIVAGVIGTNKFFYDVWGDTVNMASRMESTGVPGRIQVSPATRDRLRGAFALEPRGTVEVKGKGPVQTWFLLNRRPAPAGMAVAVSPA